MLAVLSAETSATGRPSRLAFCSSKKAMRPVAMRPGSTMLTVIPSVPTSRTTVFDQPTKVSRRAFEMPRLAIGATTPLEVEVITRPQPFAFMPGSAASVTAITERTMLSKYFDQISGGWPWAAVATGRRCCSPKPVAAIDTAMSQAGTGKANSKNAAEADAAPISMTLNLPKQRTMRPKKTRDSIAATARVLSRTPTSAANMSRSSASTGRKSSNRS